MRALIVEEGYSRGALAGARALSRAGWTVGVGSPDRRGLASSSRAVSRRHEVPPAWRHKSAFIDGVLAAIESGGYQIAFGAGEAEVVALSLHRDRIPATIPFPAHDVITRALDKVELSLRGAEAGFAVPRLEEASDSAPDSFGDHIIVKARAHASEGDLAPPRQDTNLVARGDVPRRVAEMRADGADVYLQEFVPGDLIALITVVSAEGEVVAAVQQRALQIWPPGAGASCRAVTTQVDDVLLAKASRLLGDLGWTGLAELQFIVPPGGEPHLIDLNGRFYGSLSLALAAGVNLPAVWAAIAMGRDPGGPFEGRAGVRYQWLSGDLRRAWRERRGEPGELLSCLAFSPGAAHSVAALRDPGPLLAYTCELMREARRGSP